MDVMTVYASRALTLPSKVPSCASTGTPLMAYKGAVGRQGGGEAMAVSTWNRLTLASGPPAPGLEAPVYATAKEGDGVR